MSTAHEPAYAEDGKPKLRYQLYQEEKAKGGIALSMFGGSTNVGAGFAADLRPAVRGRRRHHPVVPAAGRPDACPRRGDDGPAHPPRPADGLGRRRLAADDLGVVGPRARPSVVPEGDGARRHPPGRRVLRARRRGGARTAGSTGSSSRRTATSSTSSGRRSSTSAPMRTAGRWRTGCASRSRSSRRSGRAVGVGLHRRHPDDRRRGRRGRADRGRTASRSPGRWRGPGRSTSSTSSRARSRPTRPSRTSSRVSGRRMGPALQFAGRFRERVNLPIFHAARIADVATARYAITEGLVDMVGMTRAHMADPHIVRKLEAGEADRIRPCVGASMCINRLYLGLEALCIHNPATGREETIPHVVTRSAGPAATGRGRRGRAGRAWRRRGSRRNAGTRSCCSRRPTSRAGRSCSRRGRRRGGPTSSASSAGWWGSAGCSAWTCGSACSRTTAVVTALAPDVVIVATGGRPRLPDLTEGDDLVVSHLGHHRRGGHPVARRGPAVRRPRHGGRPVVRRAAGRGRVVARDRHARSPRRAGGDRDGLSGVPRDVLRGGRPDDARSPAGRGPPRRPTGGSRSTSGTTTRRSTAQRVVDQVVVEHGTLPNDELYLELRRGLIERRRARPRGVHRGPAAGRSSPTPMGRTSCSAIGDAVASRSIHAAIYDARRIAMTL